MTKKRVAWVDYIPFEYLMSGEEFEYYKAKATSSILRSLHVHSILLELASMNATLRELSDEQEKEEEAIKESNYA